MSFAKYIAADVLVFLLAVITLPLWLPFWLWMTLRDWLAYERRMWQWAEATRKRDAERREFWCDKVPHGGERCAGQCAHCAEADGQTMDDLAALEREHFGDPDKQTGIYAKR